MDLEARGKEEVDQRGCRTNEDRRRQGRHHRPSTGRGLVHVLSVRANCPHHRAEQQRDERSDERPGTQAVRQLLQH